MSRLRVLQLYEVKNTNPNTRISVRISSFYLWEGRWWVWAFSSDFSRFLHCVVSSPYFHEKRLKNALKTPKNGMIPNFTPKPNAKPHFFTETARFFPSDRPGLARPRAFLGGFAGSGASPSGKTLKIP